MDIKSVMPSPSEEESIKMARADAVEAALNAYISKAEAERRRTVAESSEAEYVQLNEETLITKQEWVDQAVVESKRLVAKANRKLLYANMESDDPEILLAKVNWLTKNRMPALEQEYKAHTFKMQQREASLSVDGPNALSEDEREYMQAQIGQHKNDMDTLAAAWEKAKAECDKLNSILNA